MAQSYARFSFTITVLLGLAITMSAALDAQSACAIWKNAQPKFNGNTPVTPGSDCNPGTMNPQATADAFAFLNGYRQLTGLGPVTSNPTYNANCQVTAKALAMEHTLTHNPKLVIKCGNDISNATVSTSNELATAPNQISATHAVDGLVWEWGALGHRRWILNPSTSEMGFACDYDVGKYFACVNKVIGTAHNNPAMDTVAFPPAGAFPLSAFPADWQGRNIMWSFQRVGLKSGTATVLRNGSPVAITDVAVDDSGYGFSACLAWTMPKPPQEGKYDVTLNTNLGVIQYTVNVVNCDSLPDGATVGTGSVSTGTGSGTGSGGGGGGGGSSYPLAFVPLPKPIRVLDTRTDPGRGAKLQGQLNPAVNVRSCVPETAQAIAGGVQAVESVGGGFLTVWAGGVSQPSTSSSNYQPPLGVFSSVYSSISSAGELNIFANVPTHVVFDVSGYFQPTSGLFYQPITPYRVFDTRLAPYFAQLGQTPLGVPFRGVGPIPADAEAVSVAAALPHGHPPFPYKYTYFSMWPEGEWPITTSGLVNPDPLIEQTSGVTRIGSDGKVMFKCGGSVDVALDVDGYYSSSAAYGFVPLTSPSRLIDTRDAASQWHGKGSMCLPAGSAVPSKATVLVATATAVNVDGNPFSGFVTIWPGPIESPPNPLTSAIQINGPSQTAMALALNIPLDSGGNFCVRCSGACDLVFDAIGYYMPKGEPVVQRASLETSSSSSSSPSSSLSTMAVVGIVIACIAVLVVVALAVAIVYVKETSPRKFVDETYKHFVVK